VRYSSFQHLVAPMAGAMGFEFVVSKGSKPSPSTSELGTSGSSFHGIDDVDEVVDQKDLLIPLILCLFFHSVISDVGF